MEALLEGEELDAARAAGGSLGGRPRKDAPPKEYNNLNYNVMEVSEKQGNSAEYLVRRLKRDAPEIAEALGRGEYPSARAAGIAAGIVKVPTVLEKLRKLWEQATEEEREEFLKGLK